MKSEMQRAVRWLMRVAVALAFAAVLGGCATGGTEPVRQSPGDRQDCRPFCGGFSS